MANIQTNQEFISKLKALPVAHQHRLAKQFISGVVHLSGNSRVGQLVELLAKPDCSDDDVRNARTGLGHAAVIGHLTGHHGVGSRLLKGRRASQYSLGDEMRGLAVKSEF